MTSERTKLGFQAEEATSIYLEKSGWLILARNWRRPWGELDIVARHNKTVHFVEVKASSARHPGFDPFLRADGRKMNKVKRTAQTWLMAHHYDPETEWQLDIASVIMGMNGPEIEIFENI